MLALRLQGPLHWHLASESLNRRSKEEHLSEARQALLSESVLQQAGVYHEYSKFTYAVSSWHTCIVNYSYL